LGYYKFVEEKFLLVFRISEFKKRIHLFSRMAVLPLTS